jgi:ABC-type bacteriocin transporter
MSFFATRRTGEIISRFTDANAIIDALASTMMSLFLEVWILMIVGGVLAVQNIKLFLITLISIPMYSVIILIFMKPFERMNNDVMQSNSMLSSSIIENINGIETIKSLTSEDASYKKIDREFVETLDKSFKYQKAQLFQNGLKSGMELILNVVILWVGARLVMKGQISIGQLITYNALLVYFTNPLQTIINLQTKLQAAKVANNRLNEVYLVKSEFAGNKSTLKQPVLNGDIEFKNIDFNYGFGKPTLSNVSTKIKQGSKVALVGVSGSGKTTLIKLLVNFFQPNKGQVFVNGIDIAEVDKKVLRKFVNYVPQQPFIFTGTIMENLTLGAMPGTTEEDINRAVDIAEIRDDIEGMQLKYDSELSESSGMSGGQKQRIAIARAMLTGASTIIFDESTSNLDVLTEKKIMDNLLALEDKTIIFIAHRLTIAQRAEQVIVMSKGQIIEQGSHTQLMHDQNFYYDLFKK